MFRRNRSTTTKSIFLNYRRDDQPGYVARLGDDIVSSFGSVLFRDVDGMRSGNEWKHEIRQRITESEVVLAIIGSRWETQLEKRHQSSRIDYVRYELNTARECGIPVVPILINGTSLPHTEILGDLRWLTEIHVHEQSDIQERWSSDSDRLIGRIEQLTALRRTNNKYKWQRTNFLGAVALLLSLAFPAALLISSNDKAISSLYMYYGLLVEKMGNDHATAYNYMQKSTDADAHNRLAYLHQGRLKLAMTTRTPHITHDNRSAVLFPLLKGEKKHKEDGTQIPDWAAKVIRKACLIKTDKVDSAQKLYATMCALYAAE